MKPLRLVSVVILLVVGVSAAARSQTLQDYQDAARENRSCATIPYSDVRTNCRDQGREVHDWCDGNHGPVSCDQNVTAGLLRASVAEHRRLDDLQGRRNDLLRNNQSTMATDAEIDASKRQIENLDRQISARKDLVERTMYTIDRCINYRQATMNVFAYALDKVRSVDDPQLKALAVQLKGKYQDEKDGHQQAIRDKENAKENCKSERP